MQRGGLLCSGAVHTCAEEKVVLRFEAWMDVDTWKPSLSTAAFLLHLQPNGSIQDDSVYHMLEQAGMRWLGELEGNDLFSLRNCVMALPPPCEEIVSSSFSKLIVWESDDTFPIHLLPEEVMFRVLGFLDYLSLQSLARTCRHFRHLCGEITPGLLLRLYPHQRAAIRWMMEREKEGKMIDHPCWRFFETQAGSFWGNTSTGEIKEDPPEAFRDFRGGFLCDDPGLGKTVTCIGLMTRTKGHLPMPHDHEGTISWYNVDKVGLSAYGYISTQYISSFSESDRQRSKRRKIASQSKFSPYKHAAQSRMKQGQKSSRKVVSKLIFEDNDLDTKSESWIQCDLCNTWRRLPPGYVCHAKEWCCYLHPVSRLRSCSIVPDDLEDDEHVVAMHGWIHASEEPCKHPNIEFFKDVLASHGELFSVYGRYRHKGRTILHWLMEKSPEDFHEPFSLPTWAQQPRGFGAFLKSLGFVPADISSTVIQQRRVENNKRPAGYNKSMLTENDWVSWTKPIQYLNMLPDIEALGEALSFDPADARIKTFLSPASLIVVPSELVQHWKYQISMHTAHDCLKVAVYGSSNPQERAVAPQILAWEYDVVITTFSTLSSEWNPNSPLLCSPLCQVYWQRIFIDEGHTLGTFSMTNKLQMLSALKAGSRWCLTGTPVQSVGDSTLSALKYIQPVFQFLQDEMLGDTMCFQEIIEKPIKIAPEISMWRMFQYLQRTMARSSKSSLATLPRLHKSVTRVVFSESHAMSYSSLIDLVQFNLLTSDWFDPDHTESLMAANQSSKSSAFLFNIALACNVSGNCLLQVTSDDLYETLELVMKHIGVDPPDPTVTSPPFLHDLHPMKRVEESLQYGGTCDKCSRYYRILFVTPCGCLTCVTCTATSRTSCSHCNSEYVMHSMDDPTRLKDNPNPKWDVPLHLIEWQPAYAQQGAVGKSGGVWQPTWRDTDSSKCVHLIKRLSDIGIISPTLASNHLQHVGDEKTDNKAIVFTQFWQHALLIEKSLEQHVPGFALYRKQMSQVNKSHEMNRFRHDPTCTVMLMDESGALGLDLSFVSHVFLMEPLSNKSLEDQVISRAHRMGATQDVYVETLVMKDSIEEHMLQDGDATLSPTTTCVSIWSDTLVNMDFASKEKEHAELARRQSRNNLLMSLHRPMTTSTSLPQDDARDNTASDNHDDTS